MSCGSNCPVLTWRLYFPFYETITSYISAQSSKDSFYRKVSTLVVIMTWCSSLATSTLQQICIWRWRNYAWNHVTLFFTLYSIISFIRNLQYKSKPILNQCSSTLNVSVQKAIQNGLNDTGFCVAVDCDVDQRRLESLEVKKGCSWRKEKKKI